MRTFKVFKTLKVFKSPLFFGERPGGEVAGNALFFVALKKYISSN